MSSSGNLEGHYDQPEMKERLRQHEAAETKVHVCKEVTVTLKDISETLANRIEVLESFKHRHREFKEIVDTLVRQAEETEATDKIMDDHIAKALSIAFILRNFDSHEEYPHGEYAEDHQIMISHWCDIRGQVDDLEQEPDWDERSPWQRLKS